MTDDLRLACVRAVHVLTADGHTLRAGRAVMYILEHLGFGWLARLARRRPFIWPIELGYWIVARNRVFFSRFMFRSER